MKVYIDFDGTLFDTDRYNKDSKKVFNKYGITNMMFHNAYQELFGKNKLFNLNIIADYLVDKYSIDKAIYEEISVVKNNDYVYPEVINCLKEMSALGFELYILTYGDTLFQKEKIEYSNISKYFKDIIITEHDKTSLNLDFKNSIFIDNNPNETEMFHNVCSKIVIRIKRSTDKYSELQNNNKDVLEFEDFNQIVDYMKGIVKNG